MVAKRLDQAYGPAGRTWRKVRTGTTAEAVVGGVLRAAPRVSGRTTPLSLLARSMMINVLQPPVASHPWPRTIRSSFGQLARKPVAYTKVKPRVIVELDVDRALWRTTGGATPAVSRIRRDLKAAALPAQAR